MGAKVGAQKDFSRADIKLKIGKKITLLLRFSYML